MHSPYFLVSPDYFCVEYSINPWMEGNAGTVDQTLAWKQWQRLKEKIATKTTVYTIPGANGLPDMVFCANAGITHRTKAVIANFTFPERQGETQYFYSFFSQRYGEENVLMLPKELSQEGAGDALFDRRDLTNPLLWCAQGFRSNPTAYEAIGAFLEVETKILSLTHPEYYHLDISFAPLDGGYLLYAPQSFDDRSNALIEGNVPKEKRIVLSQYDLDAFNGNAVNIGDLVIVNHASDTLRNDLQNAGYECFDNDISEFKKAGGGNKCLTLRLE